MCKLTLRYLCALIFLENSEWRTWSLGLDFKRICQSGTPRKSIRGINLLAASCVRVQAPELPNQGRCTLVFKHHQVTVYLSSSKAPQFRCLSTHAPDPEGFIEAAEGSVWLLFFLLAQGISNFCC